MRAAILAQLLPGGQALADAGGQLRDLVAAANQVLVLPDAQRAAAAAQILDRYLAFDHVSEVVFGAYAVEVLSEFEEVLSGEEYRQLHAAGQGQIDAALRARLVADAVSAAGRLGVTRVELLSVEVDGDRARATLGATTAAGQVPVSCSLRRVGDRWRLVEGGTAPGSWVQACRDLVGPALSRRYSPAVVEALLRDRPYVVLEDFSLATAGALPTGWRWFRNDDDKPKPYRVVASGDRHYLRAEDRGSSVILMKWAHWDPTAFPLLTWCWRADALPPGGDERRDATNDSAAGVYVIFSKSLLLVPRQVKYVWSTTLPVGTIDRRPKWARPYFQVVESGPERLGRWLPASVDLLATYAATYGGLPKDRTEGIGILSDANNTGSLAAAAYGEIRAWRRGAVDLDALRRDCTCLEATGAD